VQITPDLLDPFHSPWRPPKDLSETAPSPAPPAPARPSTPLVDVIETKSLPSPDAAAGPVNFNESIAELEKKLIETALAFCRGHQRKAAEHLGLSYHQMRGLLRKYGYGRETTEETSPTPPEAMR
jgi:psp operon transcriptional activator